MSLHPVLPPLILTLLTLGLLAARAATFRRSWRWGLLTGAAVLLVLAAWRPVFGAEDPPPRVAGETAPNVFVLLDRSAGMDPAAATADIETLIDRHPDGRFAVIGFTSRPSLDWPLSADTWTLRSVLQASAPGDDEVNVGAAANVLRYQLLGAGQQYPRARNLVYYLGAGVEATDTPQRDFDLGEDTVDGGAVLAYRGTGRESLQEVADQIGVPFVPRFDGAPVPVDTETDQDGRELQAAVGDRVEVYWASAAAAALLILAELFLVLRDIRRTRMAPRQVLT